MVELYPFDLGLRRRIDIRLSYHPGNGGIRRPRHMIDRTVEAFNPARFQWFNDELVHPMEPKAVYKDESPTLIRGLFH